MSEFLNYFRAVVGQVVRGEQSGAVLHDWFEATEVPEDDRPFVQETLTKLHHTGRRADRNL